MGTIFRSEEITLAQLFLQSDSAYSCVRELGELGKVQFRDLNPEVSAFQRKFVNEVRRCDEMDRKLRFLKNELEKADIKPRPAGNIEAPEPQELIDLESKFEVLEAEVKEINGNKDTLKRNLLDLIEVQHILYQAQGFFQEAELMVGVQQTPVAERDRGLESDGDGRALLDDSPAEAHAGSPTRFTFVAGVIAQERLAAFERILWRACRGNVFIRQAPIDAPLEDPTTGAMVFKVVFVLFFQGDALRTRVRKICEGFRATLYQCPETAAERQEMAVAVSNRISDLQSVLQTTLDHSVTQLQEIAQEVDVWQQKVTKVKAIYHTMNMFNLDMAQHCLVAECWCPVEDLDLIQRALILGTERSGSTVPSILNRMPTKDSPPTYFKLNKFTRGFQNIVDAYGVATYQEVNPALYTVITFPFLFAVMFGDAGHGLIMALFALTMIIFERKLQGSDLVGDMFSTIFNGRYIIFMMGVFSIYTGLVYNDVFSLSLNIFGSRWNVSYTNVTDFSNVSVHSTNCCPPGKVCVQNIEGGLAIVPTEAQLFHAPYPFGLDPAWQVAENKLIFTNSYKMKMSVILGIGQMLFGVILSLFNHIHFKRYENVIMQFVPEVLFLMSLFGWLVLLIFVKWLRFFDPQITAPSLLITLVNMFLEFGQAPKVNGTNIDDITNEFSVFGSSPEAADIQRYIQMLLVLVAVICIPWMLFSKPIYLLVKHKRAAKKGYRRHVNSPLGSESETTDDNEVTHHDEEKGKHFPEEEEDQFEFGEIFVHQAIHTIEYCLGTISNTASYLRLWALSLAHAELSEVLWQMVMRNGFFLSNSGFISSSGFLAIVPMFCVFAAWAAMTVGILLFMEGLSAFLHALRLHWVEFQNKFYEGQGLKFAPFSFEAILSGEDD